uniref:Telomeric single stranded DNA binding POT1/Cdc13 domain-containing protein n=1 Tax=Brassica campestris TaxID=3711 RepID=M4EFF1_BRACM
MERKKTKSQVKLVKLKDAINLIDQHVNLLGIVRDRKEPKLCRNNGNPESSFLLILPDFEGFRLLLFFVSVYHLIVSAWICTLCIIDDSYERPGLTVNVFSNKREELPNHDGMILFLNIKMKCYGGGNRVNAACNKGVSSFALFKRRTDKEFICYQRTSNFPGEERYKSSMDELAKLFPTSCSLDQNLEFLFLREIKEGKPFNLLCKILLHVFNEEEDMSTIFVWDGTDAPPASIGFKDKSAVSNLSVLSRDTLRSFPTVGTILRLSLSNHLLYGVKPGAWVKLYQLLCVVDKGSWVASVTDSTTITLAQNDHLVEKIMRKINCFGSDKDLKCLAFFVFASEIDDDQAPFVTLRDIITFPKVTYKYRCIVRVVSAFRSQEEDENRHYRVLLTLEDPTATLEAFLCDKDAVK